MAAATHPAHTTTGTHAPTSLAHTLAPAQIQQIKDALQEKEGIDVKQIRLIHAGKQLCVCALLLSRGEQVAAAAGQEEPATRSNPC